jgi:hypothetical protein
VWLLLSMVARAQVAELAEALAHGDVAERKEAAASLEALVEDRETEVADALVAAFGWRSSSLPPAGGGGWLADLGLGDDGRRRLATELVTWRVAVTLVGGQEVPPRVAIELSELLAPEIARYGAPTHTTDWLHLLAASGGDPEVVATRLQIASDSHWEVILDEVDTLGGPVRGMLPLLAHRSSIVRERAAERLEREPDAAIAGLSRAYRWSPGRHAPLRGEVATPALERTEAGAEKWALKLVRWARRCSRQRDDSALLATLWLLAEPATTTALTDAARIRTADKLLEVARRDDGSVERVTTIVQAMDAVIRRVPLPEGERPAPDEVEAGAETWVRAVAPYEGP